MTDKIITIFGGTGFIGKNLIRLLTKNNYRIRLITRDQVKHQAIKNIAKPGQIELIQPLVFRFLLMS